MGRAALVEAERALLSWGTRWYEDWHRRHGRSGTPNSGFEAEDVQLASSVSPQASCHLHHVRYRGAEEAGQSPLVCLHGFGTGIGQFATSIPAIRADWKGPVFALDSFGCGLSSRPAWSLGFGQAAQVQAVESYFVEPLEAWRAAMGLERMVLLGHSMGGYLAVCYALRHPQRVERLILVSPVGFPKKPPDVEERMARSGWFFRTMLYFWDQGWSPFTAVKIIGRRAMQWYVSRRYKEASWTPSQLLSEYLYLNWVNDDNSGGGCVHSTLLQPGAYARSPLCDRFSMLRVPRVSFIYGVRDWMDSSTAAAMASAAPGVAVEMMKVADGGHNMMIDNPVGFAEAVLATGSSPAFGKVFGNQPLQLEAGRSFAVGQEVKGKRGSRRAWQWQLATVLADTGDGTFQVRWHGDDEVSTEGAYLLRHADEDVDAEKHVAF